MPGSFRRIVAVLKELPNYPKYWRLVEDRATFLADRLGMLKSRELVLHKLTNGLMFYVRPGTADAAPLTHVIVKNLYMFTKSELADALTVVDIGAHLGFFSIYAAAASENVQAYAYEPEPNNFCILCKNIEVNQLQDRVHAFGLAVSDRKGKSTLYTGGESLGNSLCIRHGNPIEVMSTTLEDILNDNGLRRIDILKVDAEGAEHAIFAGIADTTLDRIGMIYIEAHDISPQHNINTFEAYLKSKGLHISRKGDQFKASRRDH